MVDRKIKIVVGTKKITPTAKDGPNKQHRDKAKSEDFYGKKKKKKKKEGLQENEGGRERSIHNPQKKRGVEKKKTTVETKREEIPQKETRLKENPEGLTHQLHGERAIVCKQKKKVSGIKKKKNMR